MKDNKHPHAFMADFVYKYETLIRPLIEEGDLETASVGIMDVVFRYSVCIQDNGENFLGANIHASVRYEEAVKLLNGLTEKKPLKQKVTKRINLMISRDVSEMELMLQGDEIYEKYRQRGEVA